MGYYFPDHKSIFAHAGWQVDQTLAAIAGRFVGQNPPHGCTFRAYHLGGILRGADFRYQADFSKIFPKAQIGQFVYAWAKYWADGPSELKFDVSCASPTLLYCNGKVVFKSDIFTERYPDQRHTIQIPLQAGWSHLVIRFEKTRAGFGGAFGTWLGKLHYYFLMPTPEREGQEGWIYTEPQSGELSALPTPGATEHETGIRWHPDNAWDADHANIGQLQRIYGMAPGQSAVAWAKAMFLRPGEGAYRLSGFHHGSISISIGDTEVFAAPASGPIDTTIAAPFGFRDIMVKSTCDDSRWGFEITLHDGPEPIALKSPCNITGTHQPWMYAGPFAGTAPIDFAQLRDLNNLVSSSTGETYWRLDAPDQWVRQYNDNPLYGQWNYPLGVTLYGLFHAARVLGRADLESYVVDHIQFCADTFKYALWDRSKFGGATNVHHLLTSIDSLDDCGSFGSVFLEVAKFAQIKGFRPIADYVADFIANRQDRLPDGTFYRIKLMHIFHENTMWADDLYMSVPFLCRYYQLTRDRRYIDDAARQFLGFKQRLFIPELKIMSHIYDFRRDLATNVPWGRGNGWTLFSLSELLAVLPEDHAQREVLIEFFRELCEGYLALQDDAGMWHQVLTHPDAYPETSCTAMFAYAFARGVQYGWLPEPAPYVKSALKAWEAINRISIDQTGNVFGVCRGSEFSFSPTYYKKELLPNLNDTHGVGIVMLAGVEVRKLKEFLQEKQS
ncbi:MAG: glycoside hydrolase family 88 protein [Tepidisphaeraceae bacterium]|jgi:rhamnogalacturonyl hydrolase YesR